MVIKTGLFISYEKLRHYKRLVSRAILHRYLKRHNRIREQFHRLISMQTYILTFAHVIRELHILLYNKLSSVRVLIGSQLWSLKGQMHV